MPASSRSFPLTERPWIPVIGRAGGCRLVGLRQLFAESDQIRTIAGDLPTQTMALLRLLLAVLHRAVDGPADERAWRTLWRAPTLPLADLDDYLDDYQDRFDLLHATTPFYQVADLRTEAGKPVGLEPLIADVPNGAPYLTSRLGTGLASIGPAEAAQWVVHSQAYDISGIKPGAAGDPRAKKGKGYPIGVGPTGALGGVFLEGATLRETLLLNLISLDFDYLHQDPRDAPVWERPAHGPAEEPEASRGPYGLLSLYTWQSRRIRLFGDQDTITGALIANGDKLTLDNRHDLEPMTAWRRSKNKEKELKLPQVYLPAPHDPARALWRGLNTLLPATTSASTAGGPPTLVPQLAQWLAKLHNSGYVEAGFQVTTRAVGVVYGTQQSVIDEIFHDALTMNVQAFDATSDLRTVIIDAAADAEAAVKALRALASNLCRAAGGSGDTPKDAPSQAAHRAAELAFASLDQRFRAWLAGLGPETNPGAARAGWQRVAHQVVQRLGADLIAQAGPAAWAGRLVNDQHLCGPAADVWFRRALRRVLPLATAPDSVSEEVSGDQSGPQ